jgi:hypothetical protein
MYHRFQLERILFLLDCSLGVIAGLDPAIHLAKEMDARVKPAHDGCWSCGSRL